MTEFVKENWKWIVAAYFLVGAVLAYVSLNVSAEITREKDGHGRCTGRMYPRIAENDDGFSMALLVAWVFIIPLGLALLAAAGFDDFLKRRGYHPMEWLLLWPRKIQILRKERRDAAARHSSDGETEEGKTEA